jgi:hypothetical protein
MTERRATAYFGKDGLRRLRLCYFSVGFVNDLSELTLPARAD